ncbi:hypothetical protein, partial [Staphylococcus aureus]
VYRMLLIGSREPLTRGLKMILTFGTFLCCAIAAVAIVACIAAGTRDHYPDTARLRAARKKGF